MVVTIYIGEPDCGQQSPKEKNCQKKPLSEWNLRCERGESPCNTTPESNPETRRSVSRPQNAIREGLLCKANPDHYNGPPPSIGLRLGVEARRVYSQMYGYLSLRVCPPRTTSLNAKEGKVCNRDQPLDASERDPGSCTTPVRCSSSGRSLYTRPASWSSAQCAQKILTQH